MIDLVTGGAGFLGRHVVHALLSRKRKVRVLDLRGDIPLPAGVERLVGSVTDAAVVAEAMDGVERVFHLAAIPELWVRKKEEFDRINHAGTQTVLAAARSCPSLTRFIHTSSEVVLVPGAAHVVPERLDETLELAPENVIGPYARSKRLAELAVLDAARQGFPATVVIPTMPLGPDDVSHTPPTRMLSDLLSGRTPAYVDVMMNIVDARDAAEGHVLAAERGRSGERYLLAGDNVTMGALLEEIAALTGRRMPRWCVPRWLARSFAALDQAVADSLTGKPPKAPRDGVAIACRQRPFNNTRAQAELGFSPRPLSATLRDAIAWLAEGKTPQEIEPRDSRTG